MSHSAPYKRVLCTSRMFRECAIFPLTLHLLHVDGMQPYSRTDLAKDAPRSVKTRQQAAVHVVGRSCIYRASRVSIVARLHIGPS